MAVIPLELLHEHDTLKNSLDNGMTSGNHIDQARAVGLCGTIPGDLTGQSTKTCLHVTSTTVRQLRCCMHAVQRAMQQSRKTLV